MNVNKHKTRILYFIGSLISGGKERRLIELLTHLKNRGDYELLLVMTRDEIHYPAFQALNIPYQIIPKSWKNKDLTIFYKFYRICKQFRPNLIHTWGRIQSLYALPAVVALKIPLINSQITTATAEYEKNVTNYLLDKLIYKFSSVILANSQAGIEAFKPPFRKRKVIYNGMNPQRFIHLPAAADIKLKYHITTPVTVIMAASFTKNKDYDTFFQVADKISRERSDITFIGIGRYDQNNPLYERILSLSSHNPRIIFPGLVNDVEALVNACDIGVLFSQKTHGEGLSNAILEYMALGKPVIATDSGGTKEIVQDGKNGFLITDQSVDEIAALLLSLVDDKEKCQSFAAASKRIIQESFDLERMGAAFEEVYQAALPESSAAYSPVSYQQILPN